MACVYTYKGKEYSEKEFKALLTEKLMGNEANTATVIDLFTPTPPPDNVVDFDKGKGKEREARRGKRIEEDASYREKLNDFVKNYTSVDVSAITALVEDYFPTYQKAVEELGVKEANKQTVDFLLQLVAADVVDTTVGKNFSRSAFAMLAAQRIIREAMETGDTDTSTMFNTVVDALGRQSGTLVALTNSGLSLDPLLNLFKDINATQQKALSQKTSSGRTKQDVLDEIKDEADKLKQEAANELGKDESLDEAVTSVTNEPKPETKVKPSKRAKLVKERADALATLKKIAFGQGLAATPKQGAQKSKELADAVIKIAKVEIQLGAYTLGEAVSKVYKQVRNYVSKQTVQEILGEVWDSDLIKLSNESRREEALEVLSDAIEGRSADKLFKALAKAMKIVNPDFIKAQKKGRRITDKQALEEILADKALAETLLNQAIEHIRAEMEMNGTYLDSVQATKPKNMSDEQWNALRAKYVISKFKQFAQTVLETAESKKEDVEIAQVVKDVAKQFYSKPNTSQSIHEALQAALPNLTLPQINKIAELVEERMQKLVESRDNRRIKSLVKDITDGKNDADMMKVLAKAMWNRGAMSTFQFANLLSDYLGFKGIPQNVITQLISLLQNTAKMPSPLARQMAMKQVNNIAVAYGETVWSYLDTVIKNLLIRNILSSTKTGFSGGLSVFFTFPAALTKQFATRPIKASRAFGNTLNGLVNGRFALKQSAKDIFIEHQTPIARELPRDANPYAKDNAWARTRKMSWKEARAMWKQDKAKAISTNVAKALIIGNFQGRYVGFTNTVNDFMSFLDYLSVSVLRDFYLGIETQRKMEMEGLGFSNKDWMERMSLDPSQVAAIDTQVEQEILQMAAIGQPVPKSYKKIRTQQLIAENQDSEVLEKAHEKALQAILMGEPTTLAGTTIRSLFQSVEKLGQPKVEGQMNVIGFALNRVTFPLTLFGRILVVLGEAGARYTPVFGTVVNMFPYEFSLKEGVPSIKRNADGSKMVKWSDKKGGDQREYAYRITASMAVTSLVAMFLSYAFDDEEVEVDGKPLLDSEGNKVTRQRYKLLGLVDFYGNSPEISQEEKGALPRNSIRMRIGTNPDGSPIFKDIPIEWGTPAMYGILKSICDTRDRQRYFDEQVMIGVKDGSDFKDLVQAPRLDVSGLSMSSGINAFNTDFSGVTRIINGIRADRGIQSAFEAILFEPNKRLVSSRQMEEVIHQIQNMNDQERIYINYKIEDDGMEGIVEYLMKDTWFTDPFIPNRENLESLDPFGFSVKFPPVYGDFMGMFGTTATYAMASHEQEHKEYYNLYKDENGVYDPQKGTFPKRYIYSEATLQEDGEKFKVKLSDDKERQISDDARREFKNLIDKNGVNKLAGYDYETRMIYLGYLWSLAKYKSVKTNLPTSTMNKPKRPTKAYMLPEDIEEKNTRFLSLD
jgi:hypothetical protein